MEKKEKTFKILAIDGGGIKGLFSAKIIQHFEETYNCYISDYFDLICGTSTGGILALALSQKIKASEICDLYEKKGKIIFPKQHPFIAKYKQYVKGGKYSSKPLETALIETFGNRCIGDSHNLLCIPAYSITDSKACVFKYDHNANNSVHNRDNSLKCVDVALATSAAPTYFPIVEMGDKIGKHLVDGGVFSNNPSIVGLIEAIRFFVGTGKDYTNAKILSISSLKKPNGESHTINKNRAFFDWKEKIFDVFTDSQEEFHSFLLKTIHESQDLPFEYYRVPSPIIPSDQVKFVQMDKATDEVIKFLINKGNEVGNSFKNDKDIKHFFEEYKTFKIK
ncbi:MAG: CBASS cGAMP-activated phospholipase [Bacteroidota bacterium]